VAPGSVAGFAPETVREIVTRAGRPDFDRWVEQVARCGHGACPVRLRGEVVQETVAGRRTVYSTDGEPDRVLLARCRDRRASVCPSCSYEYAGDMWQLLYAGAAGGRKGVPESVRAHPLVFAALTAPGFGPVHGTRAGRSGGLGRCRPPRGRPVLCRHGWQTWCMITPQASEIAEYAYHSRDRLSELTIPRLVRRLSRALSVRMIA